MYISSWQCCCKNADPVVVSRDSAALQGGIASQRNILVFPCGIKDENSSTQREILGAAEFYFRSNSFSFLFVTLLSIILRLDPKWKS